MIIPKEEVEKAAEEYCKCFSHTQFLYDINLASFINGVKFSEEYVQKHVQDIIIENQGLKLYKDNEAERFKELAVALANWLFLYRQNGMGEWKHQNRNVIIKTTEELYETFLKERNETNS